MTNSSYEHAEWIAPGNVMEGNFDSLLRISYNTLKFSHMFVYGSHAFAIFSPTRYVMGGASRAHKRDDPYHIFSKGVWGASSHCVTLQWSLTVLCGFPDNFSA